MKSKINSNIDFNFNKVFSSTDQIKIARDNSVIEIMKIVDIQNKMINEFKETGDFIMPEFLLYKPYRTISEVFDTLIGMLGGISRRYIMSLIVIALKDFKHSNKIKTDAFSVSIWQSLSHSIFGQYVSKTSLLSLIEINNDLHLNKDAFYIRNLTNLIVKKHKKSIDKVRKKFNLLKEEYRFIVRGLMDNTNHNLRLFIKR